MNKKLVLTIFLTYLICISVILIFSINLWSKKNQEDVGKNINTILQQQAELIYASVKEDLLIDNIRDAERKLKILQYKKIIFDFRIKKLDSDAASHKNFASDYPSNLLIERPVLFDETMKDNIWGKLIILFNIDIAQGQQEIFNNLFYLGSFIILVALISTLLFSYFWIVNISTKIQESIKDLSSHENLQTIGFTDKIIFPLKEFLHKSYFKQIESERRSVAAQASITIAKQVAHDIRSPLAALDIALKETSGLPEQERIIIRTASNRIHEIANQLLQTAKRKSNNVNDKDNINNDNDNIDDTREETPQKILLSSIIESIVAEKRVQFRNKQGLSIQSKLDENSYGIFASIIPREFKRILSNLINNSVEAFQNDCGNIEVSLQRLPENNNKMVVVMVKDNGKGIPSHIIAKLGTEGFSFGKNLSDKSRESDNAKNSSSSNHSGSGLGLFHTKKMVEAWNGKFEVESIEGSGTIIKLFLPEETIPKSFVPQIVVRNRIVIVDDDQSIHQVWNGRFQSKKPSKHNVEIIHFSTLSEFEKWYTQNKCTNKNNDNNIIKQLNETDLFFIDFEFINENMTGLDLIEKLNIGRSATLVTSRYEEKNIQTRCDTLGIGLIPKDLVIYVPIVFENVNNIETILIDDDMLIRLIWTTKAKEKGIAFKAYTDPSEINFSELDKNTILYIDSSLKNNQKGEELAEKLFANGFKNIYLATGYEKENFSHLTFFKGIIGKNPPW